MEWIRQNLVAAAVLLAVVASFVIGRLDSEVAQDKTREDSVALCTIANQGRALDASYKHSTGDARRSTGDEEIADQYDAYARGVEASLAISRYIEHPSQAAQVELVDGPEGPMYQLTSESKALIAEGCERALRD